MKIVIIQQIIHELNIFYRNQRIYIFTTLNLNFEGNKIDLQFLEKIWGWLQKKP